MINKRTKALMESFLAKPKGSLIIEGSINAGRELIVKDLSSKLLGTNYPANAHTYSPEEGKAIGIEIAREIRKSFRTKADVSSGFSKIIIVDQAELMTSEAQNAVLKIIEEPTNNSMLILAVNDSSQLLPTIRSRCQILPVLPLSVEQCLEISVKENADKPAAERAFAMSGGQSELYKQYLKDSKPAIIEECREFLTNSSFNRLKNAKQYTERSKISGLVSGLQLMVDAAIRTAEDKSIERWKRIGNELITVQEMLENNINVKLAYLRLSVMIY